METVTFNGPVVIIGFGSIGKAILPLIYRHFDLTHTDPITIICPDERNRHVAEEYGAHFHTLAITKENYEAVLSQYVGTKKPRGFIINVANEVASDDLALFAATHNAHYLDTVVEPWPGFYFKSGLTPAEQTNYALRESLRARTNHLKGTPTAISCCGANPGMVSWLVKEALLTLAKDLGRNFEVPQNREAWATLMRDLGVKGIHIAERDTQQRKKPRRKNEFINTWSIEGFVAEGLQPAELGWGTHEIKFPDDGKRHDHGCRAAIYLNKPGGQVQVESWTPYTGPQNAFLITHNEAISIADYYTITDGDGVAYRPTCHYAYHPTDATVESITELFTERNGVLQDTVTLLDATEIESGFDQLGVLLYGHERGAFWYGSTLTIDETRRLAPHQNATGLQVSSAIIAGMRYALAHPEEGLIETDATDHEFCLTVQRPYLGSISGHYTDWTPTPTRHPDPWQFINIRRS